MSSCKLASLTSLRVAGRCASIRKESTDEIHQETNWKPIGNHETGHSLDRPPVRVHIFGRSSTATDEEAWHAGTRMVNAVRLQTDGGNLKNWHRSMHDREISEALV